MTKIKILNNILFNCRFYKLIPVVGSSLIMAACGGGSSGNPYQPPVLSDGVIFTYPIDGQTDVHLGTRFYVTFSKAASQSAVDAACSVDGGGAVSGNFCLIGPANTVVPITATVNGKVVTFESTQLQQGTDYSLYVRGAVIGGGSTNLPDTAALFSFKTSQYDSISGSVPTVVAINGEDPGVFATTPTASARYPLMDFSTFRVEFSEPLDEKTVAVGTSFQFVDVTDGNSAVPGSIMVRKQHVSFDPDADLDPSHDYQMILSGGILDRNGEALAPITFDFTPQDSDSYGEPIYQSFNTTTAFGEAGFPQTSIITGAPLNAIDLYSPLIGANDINLRDSTLQAELADPSNFGGLIPFVIRKGGFLDITGLDLQLGGEVPANIQTGDISATFINDVTGFMDRNPYRGANVSPDDDKAPVFVFLMFDLALTGSDEIGNAVLNQTIPHVQATGTARVENGNLYIESVRTLEMDLLGLDRAPAHMVLGINSDLNASPGEDTTAPVITAAYPGDGGEDFVARDEISLIFSEPMDNSGVTPQNQISLTDETAASTPVDFELAWDGSTILLKPVTPLTYGNQYQISVGALVDLAGNALSLDPSDATGGDGLINFTVEDPDISTGVGPMVNSVHMGAPCDLTGNSYASPGRCVGGDAGDDEYLPSDMPVDGRIEVTFSQPMDISTLNLGTSCGSGAVRVEELDGGGACVGVVAGSLVAESRGFKFIPTSHWSEGTQYRLTLVAGSNTSCDANEICGENGRPLNPDPLNGAQSGDAGGGDIVNVFQAVAANDDTLLPLKLELFTDQNGNGFVDAGETARPENSAGVELIDLSLDGIDNGILTDANLIDGPGGPVVAQSNIYLSGALPVTIGQPEPLTVDGTSWGMTLTGDSQIPVRVHAGALYGTSITMEASASVLGIGIPISDVETGMSVLRIRETGAAPVYGYIVEEEGVAEPQFIAQLDLYMDAPDMEIEVNIPLLGGLIAVNHNLHSLPITAIVKGPITTLNDGRIQIEQANVGEIELQIEVSSIAGNGALKMVIAPGTMQLKVIGNPLKGRD